MENLLEGVIDTHVHSAPDIIERRYTDLELSRLASARGAAAIVLKSHHGDTAARAADCEEHLRLSQSGGKCRIFGGVTLNYACGGLNPEAVRISLKLGGKVVWMPTVDSANDRAKHGRSGGISILGQDGELLSEALDILRLASDAGAILATGHLSPREIYALAREAKRTGFEKLVVTHPEYWVVGLTHLQQRDLAENYGAVLERCCRQPLAGGQWTDNAADTLSLIDEMGWERVILATDGGQTVSPPWDEEFSAYIGSMYAHGLGREAVEHMTRTLPAKLLGI